MAQYKSYDDFLPLCPAESKPKLMEEMLRINDEIKRIHTMTLSQLQTQIDEYYDTKKSKLNESKIEIDTSRTYVFRAESNPSNTNKTTTSKKGTTNRVLNNVGCYG